MRNRITYCFVIFLTINLIYLIGQSSKEFWEKYKYSIEIGYLEGKYYQEFLKITSKNKGNRVFADEIFYEILEKCNVKSEENITYGLPPNKLVYKRLVSDTSENKNACLKGYQKDDRFFFIKLDRDFNETDAIGFVPYGCFIRLPPFELPEKVDFFEYLKKNKKIRKYLHKINRFFDSNKNYKFKMDENGVIWVFYKK